jgi:hypothetical protein
MRVTADGEGVVSHAGAELLRELAGFTGLVDAWDRVLIGTYKTMPIHFPGSVLCDLAVAIADGADSISDLKVLRDQPRPFGPVASKPTAWRVLDRVSAAHLSGLRSGRAEARAAAWAAGAGPDLSSEFCLDLDATIVIAHSDKEARQRRIEHRGRPCPCASPWYREPARPCPATSRRSHVTLLCRPVGLGRGDAPLREDLLRHGRRLQLRLPDHR